MARLSLSRYSHHLPLEPDISVSLFLSAPGNAAAYLQELQCLSNCIWMHTSASLRGKALREISFTYFPGRHDYAA